MLKWIYLKKVALSTAPLLAVIFVFWLIGRLSNTDTLRLIAHYPAGEPPVPEPQGTRIEDYDTRKAYERYLAEGTTLIFTETGPYLFEQGGNPVHPEQGDAVIAKRDWMGRRLWAVTLPASEWRGIAASPDGQYLATAAWRQGGTQVALWRDGKRAWEWTTGDSRLQGGLHVNNAGRVLAWFDPRVVVLEQGKVVASNPRLPLLDMQPALLTRSTVVPDGTALVSTLHPRVSEMSAIPFYAWENIPMEYRLLTIRDKKLIPVRKFTVPRVNVNRKNWQILADGSVMLGYGVVYAPDGTRGGEEGWHIGKISGTKDDNLSLWHGGAVVLQRNTPRGMRYRVYLPRTGRSSRLTVESGPERLLRELQVSGDGNYMLTLTSSNDFPPTPAGRIVRTLSKAKLLPERFSRRYIESGRIEVSDRDGKVCASLSGRFAPNSAVTCFAAGGQRYMPLKLTLSPDGRQLVILGQRVGSDRREFLHYTW